ncbi:MAG: HDOD domain-containing protein [Proteobacteria bacterium]|nr:HDOD domain-containing protein [Pseudomonadota bacterium]MBU1640129.1 HDOD domain-containing protein [Pseudomonadota bacterium]
MPPSLVDRLDAIEDLPTIPHTMQAVLSSLDSVSASATRLEEIIKEDPVLTAKVLKIANSAAYGAGTEISSLSRAIVTVGFDEVRNIVIGLSLSGIFCDDLGFDEFDAVELWLHSIGVATCAKMIAQKVNGLDPEEMFTAGMLHDIGRILFCLYFPDELRDILTAVENDNISLTEAEMKYGLAHSEIGAYLAYRWQLGSFMVNAIRFHHNPQKAGDHVQAAAAINLADAITIQLQIGWKGMGPAPKIMVPKVLGLDTPQIKEIAKKLKDEKEQIMSGWSSVINA